MGKKSIEVDTYTCSYCGYEHWQLNKLQGQTGGSRYICGECMIRAFDTGLGYNTPKVVVNEVKPKGNKNVAKDGGTAPPINKGPAKT
jgi:hypothetical protein